MKPLKRLAVVSLSLLPSACHYFITGPALWSHNSSAAFEMWLLLWLICIVSVCFAVFAPEQRSDEGEKP